MTPADKPEPVALCMACEGKPAPENNPCAACGATRPTSDLAERIEGLVEVLDFLVRLPIGDFPGKTYAEKATTADKYLSILAALKEVNSHDRT